MNHSSGQPNFDFESLYQVISLINIEFLNYSKERPLWVKMMKGGAESLQIVPQMIVNRMKY